MDVKLSSPSVRHRPSGVRPGTRLVIGLLLMAGALIQACSDNNGSTGPTFACREGKAGTSVKAFNASCTASPAPVTGIANSNADIGIIVQASPASTEPGRRVSIIVIVTNGSANTVAGVSGGSGQPLAGKPVFIIASGGVVDGPSGTTNAQGLYQTTLLVRCEDIGPITVAATSGGAVSSVSASIAITSQGTNSPCPPPPEEPPPTP
jgi:hypothetical protein